MSTDPKPVPYTVPKRPPIRVLRASMSYADRPPCNLILTLDRGEVQGLAIELIEFLGRETDETFDLRFGCEVREEQL